MDELKRSILDILISDKGGTDEMYQQVLDEISWHESRGDYRAKQLNNGPGTGGFQLEKGWGYETDKNDNYILDGDGNKIIKSPAGSGIASKRLVQFLEANGLDIPDWLTEFRNVIHGDPEAYDTRKLTREQQEMLVLADLRMKPGADFSKLWSGEQDLGEFWARYWKTINDDVGRTLDKNLEEWASSRAEADALDSIPEHMTSGRFILPEPSNIESKPIDIEYVDPTNQLGVIEDNIFALGGLMNHIGGDKVNKFNTGGSHESNPLGGIPQGIGSNGMPNLVEEGEVSVELPRGKYIFSNNLTLSNDILDEISKIT